MTLDRMIELLQIEHECMLRGAHGDCDRDCEKCDLVQDDGELHEMYTDVIAMLMNDHYQSLLIAYNDMRKEHKAVKPRVSTVEQRCGHCNKVIEMDGWKACPWCGKQIDWEGWWRKNGRNREIVDGNQVSSRR